MSSIRKKTVSMARRMHILVDLDRPMVAVVVVDGKKKEKVREPRAERERRAEIAGGALVINDAICLETKQLSRCRTWISLASLRRGTWSIYSCLGYKAAFCLCFALFLPLSLFWPCVVAAPLLNRRAILSKDCQAATTVTPTIYLFISALTACKEQPTSELLLPSWYRNANLRLPATAPPCTTVHGRKGLVDLQLSPSFLITAFCQPMCRTVLTGRIDAL